MAIGNQVRISLRSRDDAECVADALVGIETRVEQEGDLWIVEVVASAGMAPRLMSALKACLDENEIPSATVALNGRSYLMEGSR